MKSCIYTGWLDHSRLTPILHQFRYPMYCYGINLDELDELNKNLPLFSYNKFNLFSIHDADYLPGYKGSIKQKILQILEENAVKETIVRIELVTGARLLNYTFNPVSFYRCYDQNNNLACLVAEVNNTFGETHLYVLTDPEESSGKYLKYRCKKDFHVSPFNDLKGDYLFYILRSNNELDIIINISKEDKVVFTTKLAGLAAPLNIRNLVRTLIKYPISAVLNFPRITYQAAKLTFLKRLPIYTKPIASSNMTIKKAPPGILQRLCLRITSKFLSRIKYGHLVIQFPDRPKMTFGDPLQEPCGQINVKNYDFFVRSVFFGDIGFGESYVDQQWETNDLRGLFELFLENQKELDDRSIVFSYLGRAINYLRHIFRSNTLKGSKSNIGAHYDLSNNLFSLILDPTMTYSAAKFSHLGQDLEQAQLNKLDTIIKKAQITSTDHVLEIGCGWGSFAIRAAKQTGCRVTGITLSEQQKQYAEKLIKKENLENLITIKLCDYRKLEGQFDKIISIEMLEAVGHKYFGQFFAKCGQLLKRNGTIVLQVITFPDNRYEAYRRGCDWIQKYIFPGGLCPSLTALSKAMSTNSELVVDNVENIGLHYAETLSRWQTRLDTNYDQIKNLGFDERFFRIWRYYFSYCEAGFTSGTLKTLQMVLTKANSQATPKISLSEIENNTGGQ